jgi:hypothetical protein
MDAPGDRAWLRRGGRSTRFGPARRCYNRWAMRPARRRLQPRRGSLLVPRGTLRQRPGARLKMRETKAARAPRAPLGGPRRILAARDPAAGRVVGADEPERTRSGFRAPRREMRQSRQTASQAGVPLRREIAPLSCGAQKYVLCPRLTRPREQRLVAAPTSLQGRWRLASGGRPWLTETGGGATGESRSSNLAMVPGRTIVARSTASQFVRRMQPWDSVLPISSG